MVAVDEDRPAARSFDLLNERVLTVAGIYGPNASGKSNVLDAISWLSVAAANSLRSWGETVPREPFKFQGGPERPSSFEVEMVVNGVRYSYSLVLGDNAIEYESLHSYPERRPRQLFERHGMETKFRRGLSAASGTRELLTPTTLTLSAASRFDEPEIRPFWQQLTGMGTLGNRHRKRLMWVTLGDWASEYVTRSMLLGAVYTGPQPLSEDDRGRLGGPEAALALLRFADLGIEDIEIVEEGVDDIAGEGRSRKSVRLVHRASGQLLPFDMADESEGTRTWFRLIGPVLRALWAGRTLVFDEIDASLHPRLSARLLELFQDPATNPRNAQLIFTSHDTSLLNHLNRDEVWLTEKGGDGATALTALAEYGGDKVRRSLNLEKAYLQGRFGAVPEIDQHLLRRALGLVAEDR